MRRFLQIFHVVELLFSNKNMRRTIFFFEEKSPQSIQFPKFLEWKFYIKRFLHEFQEKLNNYAFVATCFKIH